MQTYDFRLHSRKRIQHFYRTRCIFWQEVYMCVCVEGGTFKFKFSSPFSFPAREIVNSRKTFMLPDHCLLFPVSETLLYFGNGKVRWSPAQLINRVASLLVCQPVTRQNVLCCLAKGKSQYKASSHMEPSTTLTDVSLEKN